MFGLTSGNSGIGFPLLAKSYSLLNTLRCALLVDVDLGLSKECVSA